MDSIKSAIALLNNEKATAEKRIKCIDSAITSLRAGHAIETPSTPPQQQTRRRVVRTKTAGVSAWLREQISKMPEGFEFTTKEIADRLPPHLAQARHLLTLPLRSMPVDRVGQVPGPRGYTTFRKRTTSSFTPAQNNGQLAVA